MIRVDMSEVHGEAYSVSKMISSTRLDMSDMRTADGLK